MYDQICICDHMTVKRFTWLNNNYCFSYDILMIDQEIKDKYAVSDNDDLFNKGKSRVLVVFT